MPKTAICTKTHTTVIRRPTVGGLFLNCFSWRVPISCYVRAKKRAELLTG